MGFHVFKEMAKEYGLDAPGTQSTQAAFFDYDKDGDLDMFLTQPLEPYLQPVFKYPENSVYTRLQFW